MKSSIQIHNELLDLDNKIADAQAKFNAAEGDAKDAFRDSINQYKGEQKSLNDMLSEVLAEEEKIRNAGGVPLADPDGAQAKKPVDIIDQLMGPRDSFKGLSFGQTLTANVLNASDKPYTNFGLPGVEQIDWNLPRQTSDALPNFGTLDSLPTATTNADVLTYFEKDESKYTNNAAVWTPGNEKPSSSMGWKQASAYIETIAHLMPVLEQQIKDFGQLRALINTELLFGLRMKLASEILNGTGASNTIKGILKNENVQKYAKKTGDDLADSVRRMTTDIFLATGFRATHVAMHPVVAESLELMKDKNGRYINVIVGGKLWSLQVVEDLNLTETTKVSETNKTTYGMMAYWNQAATVFTKETDSNQVGLVGNQFAFNEATIRAEGRHGLKNTYPKAFSYLADTGITR